jgi:ribosomal protein S18 acetylase RimI-like enzyme
MTIVRLTEIPPTVVGLMMASEAEGLHFLRRLIDDWQIGENRFSRRGEALFAALSHGSLVGICGLNIDPYAGSDRIGRVRHLYVSAEIRRRSVGTDLVRTVIAAAQSTFDRLRLRTTTDPAAKFYESLGFRRVNGEIACTHSLDL